MPVSFEKLNIGESYDRHFLSELWGYKGFQAISKGVITPIKSHYIILFVTKEKQQTLTQYNDVLDEELLHWEGENKHFSDKRIISAESNLDEIHLFYREKHHSSFVYYGEVFLQEYKVRTNNPSQFLFKINQKTEKSDLFDEIKSHEDEFNALVKTEKDSIIKSRIGQGLFRSRVVKLWGYCALTSLSNLSLLKASHIKPWKDSSNQERLDPMNGLLLQPTLDHLFDTGLITFCEKGTIVFSPLLSQDDIQKLGFTSELKLRKCPAKLMDFMKYHRDNVFANGKLDSCST